MMMMMMMMMIKIVMPGRDEKHKPNFIRKPELRRPRRRWHNIQMYLKETGCEMDSPAQDRDQ
jgi:hypothetical protein